MEKHRPALLKVFLRTAKEAGRKRGHSLSHKPESFLNGRKVDPIFSSDTHKSFSSKGHCEKGQSTVALYMDVKFFQNAINIISYITYSH